MAVISVGKLLTSHGVKGNVKIESWTENPKDIFNYELFDANNKQYKAKYVANLKPDIFIAEVEGITTPEMAKEFRNTELFADLNEDSDLYLEELIGAKVQATNNKDVGKIISINNYGAGDIVEIKWDNDEHTENLPLIDDYFKEITKELIVVERPEYV